MRVINVSGMECWAMLARLGATGPWARRVCEHAANGSLWLLDMPISGAWYHLPHVPIDTLPMIRFDPVSVEYHCASDRMAYYPAINARVAARVTTVGRYLSTLGLSDGDALELTSDIARVEYLQWGSCDPVQWFEAWNVYTGDCSARPCLVSSCMGYPLRRYETTASGRERLGRKFGVSDGLIRPAPVAYSSPDYGMVVAYDADNRLIARTMVAHKTRARGPIYVHPTSGDSTQAGHDRLAQAVDKVISARWGIKRSAPWAMGTRLALYDCGGYGADYMSSEVIVPYIDDDCSLDDSGYVVDCHDGDWTPKNTSGVADGPSEPEYEYTCESCGEGVTENDMHSDDGGYTYCSSCYCDTYVRCAQCGSEIRREDCYEYADEDESGHVVIHRGPSRYAGLQTWATLYQGPHCMCENCRSEGYGEDYETRVAMNGKLRLAYVLGNGAMKRDETGTPVWPDAVSYFMAGLGFNTRGEVSCDMVACGAFEGRNDDEVTYAR